MERDRLACVIVDEISAYKEQERVLNNEVDKHV
jgi:hypothetical protein